MVCIWASDVAMLLKDFLVLHLQYRSGSALGIQNVLKGILYFSGMGDHFPIGLASWLLYSICKWLSINKTYGFEL